MKGRKRWRHHSHICNLPTKSGQNVDIRGGIRLQASYLMPKTGASSFGHSWHPRRSAVDTWPTGQLSQWVSFSGLVPGGQFWQGSSAPSVGVVTFVASQITGATSSVLRRCWTTRHKRAFERHVLITNADSVFGTEYETLSSLLRMDARLFLLLLRTPGDGHHQSQLLICILPVFVKKHRTRQWIEMIKWWYPSGMHFLDLNDASIFKSCSIRSTLLTLVSDYF